MFFSRGKNKVKSPYTFADLYDFYLKEVSKNDMYYIEQTEYISIVGDFYKYIMQDVIRKNGIFKMPYGLGDLCIHKTKVKLDNLTYLNIDWAATVENGKQIYHLNEHSRKYKYFFHWSKKRKKVKNLFYYKLVMTRANKRLLAKLIKSNKYDYFEK
jgi:hypothetical protein